VPIAGYRTRERLSQKFVKGPESGLAADALA